MPRGPRTMPDCGVFHIMIRGNNKKCIFRRACEFRYFKKLLTRYKKKFVFLLYHYALMKNHIHLCLKATEKTNISKMMQGLQLAYNHYQRKKRNYVGHLWQGRFKSRIVENDEYLFTLGLYIEKNPVETKVVENPIDYPWSSYRYYALGEKDPIVDPNPLYEKLGKTPEERQRRYRDLMEIKMKESVNNKKCTG